MTAIPEHLSTWTPASESPRGWTDDELTGLAESDFGVGIVTNAEQLTLLVTTSQGVFERTIRQPHHSTA